MPGGVHSNDFETSTHASQAVSNPGEGEVTNDDVGRQVWLDGPGRVRFTLGWSTGSRSGGIAVADASVWFFPLEHIVDASGVIS